MDAGTRAVVNFLLLLVRRLQVPCYDRRDILPITTRGVQ